MFQIKTPQWRQRSCVNYSPCPRGGRVHGGAEQQIWHLLVQLTGHNTPRPLPPSPSAASNGQTQIFSYLNCSERLPIMKNNKTTEPAAIQMLLVPGRKTISGTICWREQRIQSAVCGRTSNLHAPRHINHVIWRKRGNNIKSFTQ